MNGLKSGKQLVSLIHYCMTHPDERFWQALRSWSGYHAVMVVDKVPGMGADGLVNKEYDTFYMIERRHDSE